MLWGNCYGATLLSNAIQVKDRTTRISSVEQPKRMCCVQTFPCIIVAHKMLSVLSAVILSFIKLFRALLYSPVCLSFCLVSPLDPLHFCSQNLYESIKSEPFKIPEDDGNDLTHTFFNPDREGWLLKLGE